jgi:hypothetical protein
MKGVIKLKKKLRKMERILAECSKGMKYATSVNLLQLQQAQKAKERALAQLKRANELRYKK